MASKGKQHRDEPHMPPAERSLRALAEQNQVDFELDFLGGILQRAPDYADVLRVLGNNYTAKGRIKEGLEIDRRLVRLKPQDPLAHYNLACSYAILKKTEAAIQTLRQAFELGYADFRYLRQDHDLDSIRDDPRYRALLREYEQRS